MKSFFNLFTDSAKSLKELRTLTTTGMLLALAVAIRSLAIQITLDIRIVFTFLPICVIAMLYGPVVCGISTTALDLIGFIIDNKSARGYSWELAMIVLLSGVFYGLFLYKKDISKIDFKSIVSILLARGSVIIICNIVLNSYFLYHLYINKDFSVLTLFEGSELRNAFITWWTPRITKNLVQFPIDAVLLAIVLPAANTAYKTVMKHSFRRSKAN
ncbi:MAG: folate family ECF transporter S component [Ruminococcus sp.]|nr:folate family ECF transporter S component [Ruminococcus sp.]